MKTILKIIFITSVLSFGNNRVFAQIKFKLDYQAEKKTYIFSVIPDQTYVFPKNIVGSIQVTFKVLRGSDFMLGGITTLLPETNWMRNNAFEEDDISNQYNYYTFGVEPLGRKLLLAKDQEIALFSFKNVSNADVKVELISKDDEVLKKAEKKLHIDIANNLAITSSTSVINACSGNIEPKQLNNSEFPAALFIEQVFPNPSTDQVKVSWANNLITPHESLNLLVIDPMTSLTVITKPISVQKGKQQTDIDIRSLITGNYILKIETNNRIVSKSHRLSVVK